MKMSRALLSLALPLFLSGAPVILAQESDDLETKVNRLMEEVRSLQQQLNEQKQAAEVNRPTFKAPASVGENIILSGEGGLAYFETESKGAFPNNEFRVDEAKLFLDAKLDESVFFYTELNLTLREDGNTDVNLGEIYLDFEDLSRFWGREYPLTLRAGRFNIPFGEEYVSRDAIDNPLISHSLGDLWGVDEGVELFGESGSFDYVVAVQNGGYNKISDGDPDKAITARLGFRPHEQARVSASVMRTGDIDVEKDEVAEMWFGNGYLGPIGSPETTQEFHVDLAQLNARWSWASGHVAAEAGYLEYDDDDTAADNSRDASWYALELIQDIVGKWYAGARYSTIHSADGYPVIGQGRYYDEVEDTLMDDIWRLSLGLGYRWSDQILLKTEYSFEGGDSTEEDYDPDDRNQLAAEAAFGF